MGKHLIEQATPAVVTAEGFIRGNRKVILPPVGSVCRVSGANSDYNDVWTFTEARVVGYTSDGLFGCFAKDGCWPFVERIANCDFEPAPDAAPATPDHKALLAELVGAL